MKSIPQLPLLVALVLMMVVAGCDTTDEEDEAVFGSTPVAINPAVEADVAGEALFTIDDDVFIADVEAAGLDAGILHAQHIHAEGECPPASADTNDDGYIDVVEGLPFYGAILVPLDGDLGMQAAGMPEGFPTASSNGVVDYEESADLSDMLDNLRADDPNADDPIVKLEDDGELDLPSRTVVLHGVDPDTELPETVQTIAGLTPQQSLPVACGEVALIE